MPKPRSDVSLRRSRVRRRTLRAFVATVAAGGLVFVAAASGVHAAAASPYYENAAHAPSQPVQRFAISGGYVLVDVVRDEYTIVHSTSSSAPAQTVSLTTTTGKGAEYATPAVAQAYAAALVASRGWGGLQFGCLIRLWNQESGWSMTAENTASGAYGIPQALPGDKMGPGWQDNYRVQISWGLGYIAAVYGDPCGAWASEVSRGSY